MGVQQVSDLSAPVHFIGRTSDAIMVGLFVGVLGVIYSCFGTMSYFLENALFEISQDTFLFFAAVGFFIASRHMAHRPAKLFALGLTLFCLCILFREMDIRGTNLEPYLNFVFQHRLHYAFLGVLWIILIAVAVPDFRATLRQMPRWFTSLPGAMMIVGILFYISGDLAEKHFFWASPDLSEMAEESLELLGTFFFFFSSYVVLRRV